MSGFTISRPVDIVYVTRDTYIIRPKSRFTRQQSSSYITDQNILSVVFFSFFFVKRIRTRACVCCPTKFLTFLVFFLLSSRRLSKSNGPGRCFMFTRKIRSAVGRSAGRSIRSRVLLYYVRWSPPDRSKRYKHSARRPLRADAKFDLTFALRIRRIRIRFWREWAREREKRRSFRFAITFLIAVSVHCRGVSAPHKYRIYICIYI